MVKTARKSFNCESFGYEHHCSALLLHYTGEEVFDIFETLPDTGADGNDLFWTKEHKERWNLSEKKIEVLSL